MIEVDIVVVVCTLTILCAMQNPRGSRQQVETFPFALVRKVFKFQIYAKKRTCDPGN